MHFQYTVFGPLDEFYGFIQVCYYECPHISGIYLESLLIRQHLKAIKMDIDCMDAERRKRLSGGLSSVNVAFLSMTSYIFFVLAEADSEGFDPVKPV